MRNKLIASVAFATLATLAIGCTAGDDSASDATGSDTDAASGSVPTPAGPAPGVTDDSVKVGVTYVDLEAIADVVDIDNGDYEAAYQALFDDINAQGGINGRTIEPVIEPVNPVGTEPAEAACVELTEDEDVFIMMGFFLIDAVLCPVETHQTAVIGGEMTPERLERAQAPWVSNEPGTDLQSEVIEAMAEAGEFDGTLGVFAGPSEEAQLNDVVLPQLEELGVEVAESAAFDAPVDDTTAVNAAVATIAQRFESAGVDQVLTLGANALIWALGTESLGYRPQLLLTDPASIQAYVTDDAGRDLSVLDGAVAGNLYGPDENIYDLPAMQDCIDVIDAAGGEPITDPSTLAPDEDGNHVAPFTACNQVAILRALLEAAGEDLNYGSLAAALDEGVEVQLPGEPEPVTYGAPPAGDGDRPAYLFDWDPDELDFVLREN